MTVIHMQRPTTLHRTTLSSINLVNRAYPNNTALHREVFLMAKALCKSNKDKAINLDTLKAALSASTFCPSYSSASKV